MGEEGLPTLIMGDYNAVPNTLRAVKELIEDELWEDVGAKADWWGGTPDQPTCKQRAAAKETRIDCIIANMWAMPMITGFSITKDEQIPTHSIVEVTLSDKEEAKERDYVRSLPSLKKLFDQEIIKRTEGKEKKEIYDITKEAKQSLEECMNEPLPKKAEQIGQCKHEGDSADYWSIWSNAIEKGWLSFLGHTGATRKALLGRGKVTILRRKPVRKSKRIEDEDFKHLRNANSRKAYDKLKQARRCEQFCVRLEMFARNLGTRTHGQLNLDAIVGITKHVDENCDWEFELARKINEAGPTRQKETRLIPLLKEGRRKISRSTRQSQKRSHQGDEGGK